MKDFALMVSTIGCAMALMTVLKLKGDLNNSNDSVAFLKTELSNCSESLGLCNEKISKYSNHVYRMQLIVGVKSPDSVFTWKEKVIHPIKNIK